MGSSVALQEDTEPVKLPTWHGPRPRTPKAGSGPAPGLGCLTAPSWPVSPGVRGLQPNASPGGRSATARRGGPIPGCSKAPRDLGVLSRVVRPFAHTSVSPGPSPRQCPGRHAIRARRYLAAKEFRYILAVTITAAANRGFSSAPDRARTSPLRSRCWAGLGPYTSAYAFCRGRCFL